MIDVGFYKIFPEEIIDFLEWHASDYDGGIEHLRSQADDIAVTATEMFNDNDRYLGFIDGMCDDSIRRAIEETKGVC